jgi:predicted nucleic acid-binding Zn ribbon protein
MSRRPAPRPLAAALEGLTTSLSPASTLARVQEVWEPAAGSAIAAAAAPTAERHGVLTVTCSSAVWAQELDLMAPTLLERLNGALGGALLHKLRCRAG